MNEKTILKLIWSKEQALKENLLVTKEAEQIQKTLWTFLDKNLSSGSIVSLRYQKLKESKKWTWWSDANGYPSGSPWNDMIEPFFKILEQHIAGKTIKRKLTVGNLFVQSRIQGEDEHILIGEKDGSGNKAHIIIDGKTGEIRADNNDQAPEEVLLKIETVLTLKNGKKIKTTREAMEELQDNKPQENKERKVHDQVIMHKQNISRKIKGVRGSWYENTAYYLEEEKREEREDTILEICKRGVYPTHYFAAKIGCTQKFTEVLLYKLVKEGKLRKLKIKKKYGMPFYRYANIENNITQEEAQKEYNEERSKSRAKSLGGIS